jgi:hypothetical protein
MVVEQLPPPELELLLDDEELELEELLLEDDELLEELDDELELEELLPPQLAAWGELPVTVSESMFANPPLVVATSRMLFVPAFRKTFALTTVQVVQEPVDGKSSVVTFTPLICTLPGRLLEPLANRHSST